MRFLDIATNCKCCGQKVFILNIRKENKATSYIISHRDQKLDGKGRHILYIHQCKVGVSVPPNLKSVRFLLTSGAS